MKGGAGQRRGHFQGSNDDGCHVIDVDSLQNMTLLGVKFKIFKM